MAPVSIDTDGETVSSRLHRISQQQRNIERLKWLSPLQWSVTMTETVQMRTTQEQSGDYRVYATATVGGEQPVKGLAIHTDITGRLDSAEYVEVELSEDGSVSLSPDKATTATVRFASAEGPAVRHVYISPSFLGEFDSEFEFEGEDTDLDAVPSVGISGISPSSEENYEQDKEERASAEEAADALLGESDDDSDDEEEADEESAEEAAEALVGDADGDAETEGDSPSENVEISDEEIGL